MAVTKENYKKYIMGDPSDYRPEPNKHEVLMVKSINGFDWAYGVFTNVTEDMYDITDDEYLEINQIIKINIPNISRRQCRELLIEMNLFSTVETIIDSIEDPKEKMIIKNYWETSNEFERNHGKLSLITSALGMNDDETDQFFIRASKL